MNLKRRKTPEFLTVNLKGGGIRRITKSSFVAEFARIQTAIGSEFRKIQLLCCRPGGGIGRLHYGKPVRRFSVV
jgi:hypothetical protein